MRPIVADHTSIKQGLEGIDRDQLECRLVLGFDASCVKCSGLADRLRSAAGRHIEVMPLASPSMHRWREKVLGDDAAWAPTLVRIVEDEPSAGWTGWRIAPELTQRLGPSRSARLVRFMARMPRTS